MNGLCFNTMNRSAYLLGEEDPDLLGQIAAAGRAGFECFGPDSFTIGRFCDEGGSIEMLRDAIADAGMKTFELPTLAINTDREMSRAETDRLVGIATVLRPEFVQLNLDSVVDDGVIEDLQRAGDAFAAVGTRLAIEYLPWLPEVTDMRATRDVLARAHVDGAGVLVDTWHFTHSKDTWSELESLPMEELAYVQFNDHPALVSSDLVHETLMRRVMPGDGEFELDQFAEVMKAKGYDGVVSCEVLSAATRSMDLDVFALQVFESSARYWRDDS
jgi:sugar phosphate isomerase/epimerase